MIIIIIIIVIIISNRYEEFIDHNTSGCPELAKSASCILGKICKVYSIKVGNNW